MSDHNRVWNVAHVVRCRESRKQAPGRRDEEEYQRLTMKIDKTSGSVKRMTVDQYVAERKKLKKARGFSTVLQTGNEKTNERQKPVKGWFQAVSKTI